MLPSSHGSHLMHDVIRDAQLFGNGMDGQTIVGVVAIVVASGLASVVLVCAVMLSGRISRSRGE